MALVSCPECHGKVSTTAPRCPHCGSEKGPEARTCPECITWVTPKAGHCPECGFPFEPAARPAAREMPTKRRVGRARFGKRNYGQGSGEEDTAALVFGILGLFIPLLSFIAFAMGKPGKPGRILGIVGMILFLGSVLLILAFAASSAR